MCFTIVILIVFKNITNHKQFEFKNGDLIFQDLDSSPLCDGIEQVTAGFDNLDFSHIGIVIVINNKNYILEAFTNGVDTIGIDEFLKRSYDENGKNKIIIGRLKDQYQQLIPKAIKEGLELIGKKYDAEFLINNNKFYCSELIYEIFYSANNQQPFFSLQPMTYKVNNKTLPIWIDYFNKLNTPIPEGKKGINPGGISLSKKIDIIYNYND